MKLPDKKTTILGLIAILLLFILPKMWHPGINIQNQEKIDTKLKARISKNLNPDARILSIQFNGEGAFRKARYSSVRYLLPEEDYSRFVSIDLKLNGKAYDMQSPPIRDGITYENGVAIEDFDFSQIAANIERIREDFKAEDVGWMGLNEYTIEYSLPDRNFIHRIDVFYETESVWKKIKNKMGFTVIPNDTVRYTIRQNGTGELKRDKDILIIPSDEETEKEEEAVEENTEQEQIKEKTFKRVPAQSIRLNVDSLESASSGERIKRESE